MYAGIRLAPVYLNYMKVVRALDEVAGDPDGASLTPETIRTKIDRHFEIDMVDYPTAKDMKITRDGTTWEVECDLRGRRAAVREHFPARGVRQAGPHAGWGWGWRLAA